MGSYTSQVNDHTTIGNEVNLGNVEDGVYHTLKIQWDNDALTLKVWFDGDLKISQYLSSGLSPYLGGATEAWYGMTASTGAEQVVVGIANTDFRACFSEASVIGADSEASVIGANSEASVIGANGDPHFTTFSGEKYDFHGACDLVLLQNPSLRNGLGMDIHIRTKFVKEWSYIDSAVLRIGDETLEVMGGKKNQYWINKVEGEDLDHGIAGFPITFEQINSKSGMFKVDLKHGLSVVFKSFGSFVRVDIEGHTHDEFSSSRGLMGDMEGRKVARDLETIIENDNRAFGLEWQVLETETILFHNVEGVQAPEKCALPSAASRQKRRRLGETAITMKEAEVACARVNEQDRDACIFDVLAVNSKDMAGAY